MVHAYLILGVLLGALLTIWVARAWRRTRMRRRFRRAKAGEIAAAKLLERRGYRLLGDQVRQRAHMFVDGERVEYEVRADLLVSRWWRTYVVEVKTGGSAPNPKTGATRRQLREYAAVYEVDGLLLADMTAGEIHEIRFPRQAANGRRSSMTAVFVLGALVGVAAISLLGG